MYFNAILFRFESLLAEFERLRLDKEKHTQSSLLAEQRRLKNAYIECIALIPESVIPPDSHMRSLAKSFSAVTSAVASQSSPELECELPSPADDIGSYRHVFATVGAATITGTLREQTIVFGDALTRVLMSSSIHGTANHPNITLTMAGIQPACGDFHAQMNLGTHIGLSLDADRGENSKGSHQHLKLITRRNQADGNWKANFSSNQRFLREVTYVHAVGYALKHWGMETTEATPSRCLPSSSAWEGMSKLARKEWFEQQLTVIVENVWAFSIIQSPSPLSQAPRSQRVEPHAPKVGGT